MSERTDLGDKLTLLFEDKQFQRHISQVKAKALLEEISGETKRVYWNYTPGQLARNLTAGTLALESLSRNHPEDINRLKDAAEIVATAWESLSKLNEGVNSNTSLLNSAVAYEIAGYQANAVCIARKLQKNLDQENAEIPMIGALFIQRLFLKLILTSRNDIIEPDVEKGLPEDIDLKISKALTAKGLSTISQFFLSGEKKLVDEAIRILEEANQIYSSLGLFKESNLLNSIISLVPIMVARSTWTVLNESVMQNPKWTRYLKLLSRGTGKRMMESPSVSEFWPSQLHALEHGLLGETSKIIRMPTSAGKTMIAELVMIHTLITYPGAKCIYVAPYRALVYELEQTFLTTLSEMGYRISTVLGTYESDDYSQLIMSDADILIMTPERLDLLQRARPEFLEKVRLFILDEGHILSDGKRGVKFEILITRLKKKLPKARYLFLSAVIPDNTLADFARWFEAGENRGIFDYSWRPSIQRYAEFRWSKTTGTVNYVPDKDIPQSAYPKEFVPNIIRQRTYEHINPDSGRLRRPIFPENENRSQVAAELAYKFAELGPVLVFCAQTTYVMSVAKAVERRLELAGYVNENIPWFFKENESTRSYLTAKEWLGETHRVTRLLKRGIAVHHGRLPDEVRKSIELDFREQRLRIIVSTNTLAQGVNLPIKSVIVHSCNRYDGEGSFERLPARDYWNIAGRAGRAGRETEGIVLHMVMNSRDDIDFKYYLSRRENVEPVQSALFQLLKNLSEERLSEEYAQEILDPEVLALLVEEGTNLFSDDSLDKFINSTLVGYQAIRENKSIDSLKRAFKYTYKGVIERAPSEQDWRLYSSTGLGSSSCNVIKNYVLENIDQVKEWMTSAVRNDLEELVESMVGLCLKLPEMAPTFSYSGSYSELSNSWIKGDKIQTLMEHFSQFASGTEGLGKIIEDLFTFKFPWGISAFIRIACELTRVTDDNLSPFIKYLPSMMKFGVPDPLSSWAIASGIPLREKAMEIASSYIATGGTEDVDSFRNWISKLDMENLRYDVGLEGAILEDVSRTLRANGGNELLQKYSSIEEILPYHTRVVGIAYENRRIAASRAKQGELVELIRDYDNIIDRNAVMVKYKGSQIGYLEKNLAQLAAPELDSGLSLFGEITKVERKNLPWIYIQISKLKKQLF